MKNNTPNTNTNNNQFPAFVIMPENPGYKVYSNGTIQNIKSGRFLNTCKHVLGYRFSTSKFFLNGKKRQLTMHKIVANAFLGAVPEGYEIHHKDNDKANNSIYNLAYVTRRENMKYAWADGCMDNCRFSKVNEDQVKEIRQLIAEGNMKIKDIAAKYNLGGTTVSAIKSGQNWKWLQ